MPKRSQRIALFGCLSCLFLSIIVLACAKQGLLHTSIAKPHHPADSLRLPPRELPSSQELQRDITKLRTLRDNLLGVKRSGATLDLSHFLSAISQMKDMEQSLGLIGQVYEGLKRNGEFSLRPGKWARISLRSYCLNSGLASPVSNELFSIDKIPAKYEDWLPSLVDYTRTHPDKQRNVQHVVWKLSRGAEYQDLNEEEKKLVREAIPDFTRTFSGLIRFFKGWAEDWRTLFQDITRVETDLEQRKSKLTLSEPPTRWLLLKNGLGIRIDYAKSYRNVYLTVVNLNLPNRNTPETSFLSFLIDVAWAQETGQMGETVVFHPSQYILQPGRQDVQPLAISSVWGDPQLGEVADLLSQIGILLQEIGVSVIPGVNDVVDFYEFLFGRDYLSGRELTSLERSLSAVGLIIGSGHGFRKGGEKLGELIQEGMKRGTLKEGAGRGATRALEQALEGLKPKYTASSAAHVDPYHVDMKKQRDRSKFLPQEGGQSFADEVTEKAWKQGGVSIQPIDGRIRFDADLGRTIGTRGETRGRVILDPGSGEVITQFPQK